MKVRFIISICLALLLSGLPAHARGQAPEALVREFYLWYGSYHLTERPSPVHSETMYDYVYPCTVKKHRIDRERGVFDYDYFLGGQDFWQELLDSLQVYDHIKVNDDTSIVPIGFGTEPTKLVFVKEENDRLYIIKVEDIFYMSR